MGANSPFVTMLPHVLASFGLSIIPCHQGTGTDADKKPRVSWKAYQTTRAGEAQINQWVTEYPEGINWAIVTGIVSGVIVLDIDSAEGEELADRLGLPLTPSVRTAHGRHLYFRHPGFAVRNFAKRLPGIDFRGDGGYVMAPGAIHPTGVIYDWIDSIEDVELADAPDWLLELIRAPDPRPSLQRSSPPPAANVHGFRSSALTRELERLAAAPDGARNVTLNTVAFKLGTLVGAGTLERGVVEGALLETCERLGLMDSERHKTVATITRALDDGQRSPRDLSRVGTLQRAPETWPRTAGNGTGGYTNGSASGNPAPASPAAAPPTSDEDPDADLFDNVFVPTIENRRPPTEPTIRLQGERVGSAGNLSLFSALQGHGKSSICEALCACSIDPSCDSLGYSVPLGTVIYYLDTEQDEEDHLKSWDRMRRRAGLRADEYPPDNVQWRLIATEPDIDRRRRMLWRYIEAAAGGLIIVDALLDFVVDPNDLKEVTTFLYALLAHAKRHRVSVFGLIHPNPQVGNDKPMGHLGSVAMRRAESVFTLLLDAETEVRTVTAKRSRFPLGKNRSGPRTMEVSFRYDDAPGVHMMVTCEPPEKGTRADGARTELRELARKAYEGRVTLRRHELVQLLVEATGTGVDNCKAKVGAMAKAGIIERCDDGSGYLYVPPDPPW